MRSIALVSVVLLAASGAFSQQVRIVPGNVTLQELVGSGTLVTVVTEDIGAEDPNLRVV